MAEYIAEQPPAAQSALKRVRNIVRRVIPKADEVISYGIPAYKLDGKVVVYFAGWKEHYSIYPSSTGLVSAFKKELQPYELSKGTIRFPLLEPVPAKLIGEIVRFRVSEVEKKLIRPVHKNQRRGLERKRRRTLG